MLRQRRKAWLNAMLLLPCIAWGNQHLTLDQLLGRADEQSVSIKAYALAVQAAQQDESSAKAERLPDVQISASVGYLGDGLLAKRDFSSWQHIDNPHFMNSVALKAQQVIFSGGAIDSKIAIARISTQMARLEYSRNRQDVRFLLVSHYLDLCRLQNRQEVVERNIALTEKVVENTKSRYQQGTALKTDITRYELQLESLQLQLTKLKAGRTILSHQIANMLHMDQGSLIVADYTSVSRDSTMVLEQQWQKTAAENNTSLQMARFSVKMNESKVKLEKSELFPKVAIKAEDHLDGPITIEVPVIDKNFNYWFAGIGISYNLSSLYKSNKKVRQSKTILKQSKEQLEKAAEQTEDAIQATFTDYLTAFSELNTNRKSVELAGLRYKVTENRYSNGLALLTDMLDASNSKLEAELSLVDADINTIFYYYKLKYISGIL